MEQPELPKILDYRTPGKNTYPFISLVVVIVGTTITCMITPFVLWWVVYVIPRNVGAANYGQLILFLIGLPLFPLQLILVGVIGHCVGRLHEVCSLKTRRRIFILAALMPFISFFGGLIGILPAIK